MTRIGDRAFSLVAKGQSVVTDEDQSISITLLASGADGDSLTYTVVSQPSNGVLTGTAPNLTYKPNADFNGKDSFTFKANDGELDSEIATIILEITEVIKLEGDVNGDKTVNIFDLVMVASNFGKNQEVAAVPTILKEIHLTIDQKRKIESGIDQLESQLTRTTPEEIVLNFLKLIHPERLPTETQLLPNYPNPFNPENMDTV